MKKYVTILACLILFCSRSKDNRPDVIFDTDANNELDDQHAIAYLLMNDDLFNTVAITTNVTVKEGGIQAQVDEAERVAALVNHKVRIYPGATGTFEKILPQMEEDKEYDGHESVEKIIREAAKHTPQDQLILIAVGKLTNVALAIAKAPEIIPNIRLVFLGSNLPFYENEWNLINDIPALNHILSTDIHLEIVPARYNKPSGTDAVRISRDQVRKDFCDLGPDVRPVEGRHGGQFTTFGDYSINLFEKIKLGSDGKRALYDLVAVAIVKNPAWGTSLQVPAPRLAGREWIEQPENPREITVWSDFDRDAIIGDFILTLNK